MTHWPHGWLIIRRRLTLVAVRYSQLLIAFVAWPGAVWSCSLEVTQRHVPHRQLCQQRSRWLLGQAFVLPVIDLMIAPISTPHSQCLRNSKSTVYSQSCMQTCSLLPENLLLAMLLGQDCEIYHVVCFDLTFQNIQIKLLAAVRYANNFMVQVSFSYSHSSLSRKEEMECWCQWNL